MPDLVLDEQGQLFLDTIYQPYEWQRELHTSQARNILAIGGWGSGKSSFLIGEALYVVSEYPGADVLLLRRNWKELEKGLILDWHNTVPEELYRYNKQEHVATMFNGSHVFFGHLQNGSERDLAQYLSSAFVFIGIDELGQFSYQAYTFIFGRARVNKSCQPNAEGHMPVPRVAGATNPMGPGYGWVKNLWIEKKPPSQLEESKPRPDGKYYAVQNGREVCIYDPADYHFKHSTILDNPVQLDKDPEYIQKLEKLPPALRQKALYGDLNSVAGSYFGNFSWERNVRSMPKDRDRLIFEDWQPCWMSMDWGLAHYTSIYWHTRAKALDLDGKWKYICVTYREKIIHEMTVDSVCELVDSLTPQADKDDEQRMIRKERERLKMLWLSPDRFKRNEYKHVIANEMSDWLHAHGLPRCAEAADARIDGAVFLYGLIEAGEWIILDNCPILIRAIETRTRDEKNLEDVVKTDDELDDAYDGARYGVFSMLRDKGKPKEVQFAERLANIPDPMARTIVAYKHLLQKQKDAVPKPPKIVPRWRLGR